MGQDDTKVVLITNVSPQVTRDHLKVLFGYLGKIDDIRLYPKIRPADLKICYIKFYKKSAAAIAQCITGTVLFDRALIVTLEESGEIPDEDFALAITKNGTIVSGLCSSEATLPPHVITTVTSCESTEVVETFDPNLEENGLPQYPALPASYDPKKIEEIRRTVQIEDVDSGISNEDYLDFFRKVAEVKYMCRLRSTSSLKNYMLVEFSDQPSIIKVLKMNGSELKGNPITIVHATQVIVKPDREAMQKKIAETFENISLSKDSESRSKSRSLERHRRSQSQRRSSLKDHRQRSHRRSRSRSRRRKSKDRLNLSEDNVKRKEKRSDRSHRSRSRDRKKSRSRSRSKKRSSKRKHSRSTSRKRKRDKKHHRRNYD